jgi:tetratricopeptide (TPR) repeat protein
VGIIKSIWRKAKNLNFALPVEWIGEGAKEKIRERPIGEGPGAPAPDSKPKESWFDRAEALEKAQDWPGLLAWGRRWTQAEPGNDDAWFSLGFAYGNLGRNQEAITAYREALRLKPDFVEAWCNLGVAYRKLGRYPEAIEAYREALRLKPDHAEAWNNLGAAYGRLGHFQEAIDACRKALRLKPDYAEAWNCLGVAYALSGNKSAALEAVKELRRYDPQQAEKLLNLIMKR